MTNAGLVDSTEIAAYDIVGDTANDFEIGATGVNSKLTCAVADGSSFNW
jgi:hypothetical protein